MTDGPTNVLAQTSQTPNDTGLITPLLAIRKLAETKNVEEALEVISPRTRFPLRDLAPDVLACLVGENRFSVRERKTIAAEIGEDIDPHNPRAFYEAYLDRVEPRPHAACFFEALLIAAMSPNKARRKLEKKPVGAMRFNNRHALTHQVENAVASLNNNDALSAEFALGLFFEYAVRSYNKITQELSPEEIEVERLICFSPEVGRDALAAPRDNNEPDSRSLLEDVDALLARSTCDADAFDDGVTLLYGLLEDLESDAPPTHFERFAALATALPNLAAAAHNSEINALTETLESHGGPPAAETMAWIRANDARAVAQDLLCWLESSFKTLDQTLAAATDAKEQASIAIADDDIVAAQRLLSDATEFKTAADEVATARAAAVDAFRSAVAGEDGIDVVEEAMRLPDLPLGILRKTEDDAAQGVQDNGPPAAAVNPEAAVEGSEETAQAPLPENKGSVPGLGTPSQADEDTNPDETGTDGTQKMPASENATEAGEVMSPASDFFAGNDLRATEPDTPHAALFAVLIETDCLGVAAEIAEALPSAPVSPRALRAASLARSPASDFTPAAQRLGARVTEAAESPLDEISGAILFGAALHAAVFVPAACPRAPLGAFPLGRFGPHLNDLRALVAELEYQFPPTPEELARLVGTPREPRRARILRELEAWARVTSQRSGPCQPSTKFMHRVVNPKGGVGAAIAAIKDSAPDAEDIVKRAIARYGTHGAVNQSLAEENAPLGSRSAGRLPRTTVDYLARRFEIATELLGGWLAAGTAEGSHDRRRDDTVLRTTKTLKTFLVRSAENLMEHAEREDDTPQGRLRAAVAAWIAVRVDALQVSLRGADIDVRPITQIEASERDRLPPAVRAALVAGRVAQAAELISEIGVPDVQEARKLNLAAGAFAAAGRLQYLDNAAPLLQEQADFATRLRANADLLARRAITLSKLDLAQQELYPALTRTLETSAEAGREAEEAARASTVAENLRDLEDHQRQLTAAEAFLDEAEAAIRKGQFTRVNELKTAANAEDAQAILEQIAEGHTPETIENRIALLRDGRSIGLLDDVDDGPMADFSSSFIEAATAEGWLDSVESYAAAFAGDGLLATETDRRGPAEELMGTFVDVRRSVAASSPAPTKIRKLLEELGFRSPALDKSTRVQSAKAWTFALRAEVRTEPDNWFLPPIFGSRAKGRYLLLVADGAVLPETLVPALDPDEPALVLVTARLNAARRRELATRLRGASQPAVLIDETLVAFAATRRETRLEVVFACGLPYGRVEPYLTDATVLPPEMFFGREDEIRKIMRRSSDGCLVYGGRQLGKSALLSHIEKTRHDHEAGQIIVRDQVTDLGLPNDPAKNIWNRLHAKLSRFPGIVRPDSRGDRDKIADTVKLWLSQDTRRRVIALFDETDEFLSAESASGFREITKLKDLMESTDRAFKVVFAGLHNVQRLYNVSNSPLAHLGEPIVIGPLNRTLEDKRAAHELVVAPMRAAGFRYENLETPDKILAYANDYPSLVQEYSKGLLAQLHRTGAGRSYAVSADGPLWTIPDSTLFDHEDFARIQENIRKKFRWTLDLDVRYALVAYTLALLAAEGREHEVLLDGLPPRDILEEAASHWPQTSEMLDVSAFEVILDEMWDLGILGRRPIPDTARHLYCLRSPQVAAILGTWEDVVDELEKIKDREGKPRYDKATYRRRVLAPGNRQLYLPLTDLQIERLLDPARPGVKIVCGLKLLALDKVGPALSWLHDELTLPGPRVGVRVRVEQTSTTKEFRKRLDAAPARGTNLTVLAHMGNDPDEIKRLVDFADRHPKVIGCGVRPIFLVDATDQRFRHLAARRKEDCAYLAPWGMDMLKSNAPTPNRGPYRTRHAGDASPYPRNHRRGA